MFFSCGCGFRGESLEDAREHCKKTGHKLDVKGMVTPKDVKCRNVHAHENVNISLPPPPPPYTYIQESVKCL